MVFVKPRPRGRARPHPVTPNGGAPGSGDIYGALDLGTNNCRLLVARPADGGFRVIDAFSRIVRLGERLEATGELAAEAMERTLEALAICRAKLDRRGVTRFRGVATEACRRARNGADFLARVRAETGLVLEIIGPAEEARLALAGCAPLLAQGSDRALLFDIGGGSTEVLWLERSRGPAWDVVDSISLRCGVVPFTERYGGDRLSQAAYAAMVSEVADMLGPFEAAHAIAGKVADGGVQMLGTSGTVTTIAGVRLGLARYDRAQVDGSWLDLDHVFETSRALAALDWPGRAAHPCIGPERADLVVSGCAILEAICRLWPVARLRVADRGLREGILLGLMGAPAAPAA